jgi:hypothetical protein
MDLWSPKAYTDAAVRQNSIPRSPTLPDVPQTIETAHWYDALTFGVEGKAFPDTSRFSQRLPDRAQQHLRPELWSKVFTSAGFCVRFRSDSPRLWARWRLAELNGAARQETLLRRAGLDLYARDTKGTWRWAGQGLAQSDSSDQEALLTWSEMDPQPREYLLYLPLGSACEALHVGTVPGATLDALPPRTTNAIVFYGTSIVHGGAASRPGMAHPHILGRRLDVPVYNLGFPGQGQLDLPIADLLGELDTVIVVIDCLPNCSAEIVADRTGPFVRRLREHSPSTPIVLVEEADHPLAVFSSSRRQERLEKRATFRAEFRALADAGIDHLHYIPGGDLFGDDGEATIDGIHPTDVGFLRQATVMEPVLRGLLPA